MKRKTVIVFVLFVMSMVLANFLLAEKEDDFQAIKKAVKENPKYEEGKEAKWFKILVQDAKTKKDKVKITLPLSLVEVFLKIGYNKHLKIDRDDLDIDLMELFAELKKIGPMALIEVYEDDNIVKIWLE